MQPTEFAYWLKGYFEINNQSGEQLSAQQVQIIKDHLDLVFKKETPSYTTSAAVKLCSPVPIDGYGVDLRKDGNLPCYTGIDEMERATSWASVNNVNEPYTGYFNALGIKDLGYGFTNSNKGLSGIWRAKTLEDIEWEKSNSGPIKDNSIESGPQNPENWKNLHSYIWDVDRKVWTVDINPHIPVEITQTYDGNVAFWPQASC